MGYTQHEWRHEKCGGKFSTKKNEQISVTLYVDFSYTAEHLKVYPVIVSQYLDKRLVGRLTLSITAVRETEDFVFGNRQSGEIHSVKCPFWSLIHQANKVVFSSVQEGVKRRYNGCAFCLREHDTG